MMPTEKIYYQIILKQESPLRIGTNDGIDTDNDVLTDKRGCPFIPGSSLAGVLRAKLEKSDSKAATELFGDEKSMAESRVLVSDAVLPADTRPEEISISRRDGVGLNDWGRNIKGAKYDFQVSETRRDFTAILELDARERDESAKSLESLMLAIQDEGLTLGARTTRGYGFFKAEVKRKSFSLPEELEKWLDYNPFDLEAFSDEDDDWKAGDEGKTQSGNLRIQAEFQIVDGFNIRVKTSSFEHAADDRQPDSVPLMAFEEKAVIPGTAWAGVFRHHMHRLIRECRIREPEEKLKTVDALFGVMEKKEKKKSAIRFLESRIEGGYAQKTTRNAVERVTQAPKNGGVFTVSYWNGGEGTLSIEIDKDRLGKFELELVAATLIDFHLGLAAIGGESGIGRGRIQINRIRVNEEDVTETFLKLQTDFLED